MFYYVIVVLLTYYPVDIFLLEAGKGGEYKAEGGHHNKHAGHHRHTLKFNNNNS